MKIYLMGSLRNPDIPAVSEDLRSQGYEVFDDWYAAGPDADDHWRDYEKRRGRTFEEALKGYAAVNVFNFDKRHLDAADAAVLVYPAGKSAHLELGYMAGKGKPTLVFYPEGEPERWDIMYQFTQGICLSRESLLKNLKQFQS